jgi:hypothetical protein
MPDDEVAWLTGRSAEAVRIMRNRKGIARADDGRPEAGRVPQA